MEEVTRTQITKLDWPTELAESFRLAVIKAFPSSLIEGFEALIEHLTNHPKDRHVLAAAIVGQSDSILTFDLRDFPEAALAPYGITALHPQYFLLTLYEIDQSQVISRISEIAAKANRPIEETVLHLGKSVPKSVSPYLSLRIGCMRT